MRIGIAVCAMVDTGTPGSSNLRDNSASRNSSSCGGGSDLGSIVSSINKSNNSRSLTNANNSHQYLGPGPSSPYSLRGESTHVYIFPLRSVRALSVQQPRFPAQCALARPTASAYVSWGLRDARLAHDAPDVHQSAHHWRTPPEGDASTRRTFCGEHLPAPPSANFLFTLQLMP